MKTLDVFPNPSGDFVSFKIPQKVSSARICIYDLQGRIVLDEEYSNYGRIWIGYLANGIYICQMNCDGNISRGKLVKK